VIIAPDFKKTQPFYIKIEKYSYKGYFLYIIIISDYLCTIVLLKMLYLPYIIGIIYFALSVFLIKIYTGRDENISTAVSYLKIIGLVLFGIFVFKLAYPITNFTFLNVYFLTLFIINLFFISLSLFRPIDYIGLLLNPIVFISLLIFIIFDFSIIGSQVERELYIHIIFSLSSYGFLALAGMQAFILRYQINNIKNINHSSLLNSFPSIEEMGRIMYNLIFIGFILLTLSLLSGVPYISSNLGYEIEQKIIFSLVAWFTFLYLILKKSNYGINDIAAANMTIGGLIFLLLAYLGTKFLVS